MTSSVQPDERPAQGAPAAGSQRQARSAGAARESNADEAAQARSSPDLLSIIGVAAIAILVWLMEAAVLTMPG
jgi:hypothetical protein